MKGNSFTLIDIDRVVLIQCYKEVHRLTIMVT